MSEGKGKIREEYGKHRGYQENREREESSGGNLNITQLWSFDYFILFIYCFPPFLDPKKKGKAKLMFKLREYRLPFFGRHFFYSPWPLVVFTIRVP
ncbi:hypothetical protein F4810DRAFT_466550 [Camillea tinctor]|nr:hypothetical protein F4810DRAFT_466550 [Camillea tinctor]